MGNREIGIILIFSGIAGLLLIITVITESFSKGVSFDISIGEAGTGIDLTSDICKRNNLQIIRGIENNIRNVIKKLNCENLSKVNGSGGALENLKNVCQHSYLTINSLQDVVSVCTRPIPSQITPTFSPKSVFISKISPSFGKIGDRVTIYGSGFDSEVNYIKFGPGFIQGRFPSPDGKRIQFLVPSELSACNPLKEEICIQIAHSVQPNVTYYVSVINNNGTSNPEKFEVVDLSD